MTTAADDVAIALNRLHWPVTVLGPGRRVGIWMQGCSIGCRGCVSRDTWPAPGEPGSAGNVISIDDLLSRVDALVCNADDRAASTGRSEDSTATSGSEAVTAARSSPAEASVDGFTVSGGEPFDQAEALEALLGALRNWLDRRGTPDADIIVYTGYDEPAGRDRCPAAFSLADAVIVGPYRAGQPGTPWWGSGNQRLIARDDSMARRYDEALRQTDAGVQVSVETEGVFMIGIPAPGTLARVESKLAEAGIGLDGVSWRP